MEPVQISADDAAEAAEEEKMEVRFGTRLASLVLACSLLTGMAAANPGLKTLGDDAAGDAPPGADLLALAVGREGSDLHVRFTMDLVPEIAGLPEAGIQWSFRARGTVYAIEAHPESPGGYGFTLYEVAGGVFRQIEHVEGSVDAGTGEIDAFIPLGLIGASRGTKIDGAPSSTVGDVEVHQHAGPATRVVDEFSTTKGYKIR